MSSPHPFPLKSDKAWLHHASASIMMALSGFCRNVHEVAGRDVEAHIEAALTPLLHTDGSAAAKWGTARHQVWLTTRLTMVLSSYAADIYRSAPFGGDHSLNMATKILLASSWRETTRGTTLSAALLQEQAAICSLLAPPQQEDGGDGPRLRAAAQQMARAGHLYQMNGLTSHALHCYGAVSPVYTGGWALPDMHVHHSLAVQLSSVGATKDARKCILKLVCMEQWTATAAGRGQPGALMLSLLGEKTQRIVLQDLFRVLLHSGESVAVESSYDLKFPRFDDESIRTMVNENPAETSATATGWSCVPTPSRRFPSEMRRSEAWTRLRVAAAECRQGWSMMNRSGPREPEYVSKKQRAADLQRPPQWCSMNEPVEISVLVRNPLRVSLTLMNVVLTAEMVVDEDADSKEQKEAASAGESLRVVPLARVVLAPETTHTLRLRVIPLQQGELRVNGLRWELCCPAFSSTSGKSVSPSRIPCEHKFELPGKLLQDSRQNRARGARQPDTRLMVTVVGRRPWLGATLSAPSGDGEGGGEKASNTESSSSGPQFARVMSGRLLNVALGLRNYGDGPAKYVSVSCGRPNLMVCKGVPVKAASDHGSLFELPELGASLTPAGHAKVPLLFRAPLSPGKHEVKVMIEYSSEPTVPTDIGACVLSGLVMCSIFHFDSPSHLPFCFLVVFFILQGHVSCH